VPHTRGSSNFDEGLTAFQTAMDRIPACQDQGDEIYSAEIPHSEEHDTRRRPVTLEEMNEVDVFGRNDRSNSSCMLENSSV